MISKEYFANAINKIQTVRRIADKIEDNIKEAMREVL